MDIFSKCKPRGLSSFIIKHHICSQYNDHTYCPSRVAHFTLATSASSLCLQPGCCKSTFPMAYSLIPSGFYSEAIFSIRASFTTPSKMSTPLVNHILIPASLVSFILITNIHQYTYLSCLSSLTTV